MHGAVDLIAAQTGRRPSAIIWRTVRSVTARYSAASLIVMYRRDNGGASAMPGLSVS
ncbi:Uncharacterised protein [Mycobacterium tuberculosis]|nr:Uncharacterised protein [Mycobacterium tuberculosis]